MIGRNRFRSPIIQADVVKMFYNASVGRYVTQDSYLSNACDFSRGLCIDAASASTSSRLGEEGSGGVQFMGSLKTRSVSIIDFRRSFLPSDQHDAPIALDGPTQVCACARQINNPLLSACSVRVVRVVIKGIDIFEHNIQVIVAIGSLNGVGSSGDTGSGRYGVGGIGYSRTSSSGSSNSFRYPLSRGMVEMGNITIDFSSYDIENKCPAPKNRRKFEVRKVL